MKLKITREFKDICQTIIDINWTEEEWARHESEDWFVTCNYEGGYNARKKAFCFLYVAPNLKDYWFQIKLDEVNDILSGKIDKVKAAKTP